LGGFLPVHTRPFADVFYLVPAYPRAVAGIAPGNAPYYFGLYVFAEPSAGRNTDHEHPLSAPTPEP
jgi:hypothetical protein